MKKMTWYYICTFGIGYLIAKKKAKKIANQTNTELTVSDKVPFDVLTILEAIGGQDNYVSNTATISSIKIEVKDIKLIDKEKIKKMGAKGTIQGQNNVTCLFGDYSKKLSELINQYIEKK